VTRPDAPPATVDHRARTVRRGERAVRLPPIPCFVVDALCDAWPDPVGKAALIQAIWDERTEPAEKARTFNVHLHRTRQALQALGLGIETVREPFGPRRMEQTLLRLTLRGDGPGA